MVDFQSKEQIASFFEILAHEFDGLPMYTRLTHQCANSDLAADILMEAPSYQRRPVLLFAAVHSLLLGGADHELSQFYPSLTPDFRRDDAWPSFERFMHDFNTQLREVCRTRNTQTNEVNRCAPWLLALAKLEPQFSQIALLEVGCSAGLNLYLDSEQVRAVLACRVEGDGPDLGQTSGVAQSIPWRHGIDIARLDVTSDDDVRWLRACLWPEQPERLKRFDTALEVARANPPQISLGDALELVGPTAASAPPDLPLVVITSQVLSYLDADKRVAIRHQLAQVASQRSAPTLWLVQDFPGALSWVDVPEPRQVAGLLSATYMSTAQGLEPGSGRALAWVHHHGSWLSWI